VVVEIAIDDIPQPFPLNSDRLVHAPPHLQISSAVLITLLGAAPAPVSARLIPTLMGLPVCADAPEREKNPMMKAATNACSAVPHIFAMVSSRMRNVGALRFSWCPICAFRHLA
jgi:hypothetical protein